MRSHIVLKVAGIFLGLRVLLGLFYIGIQASSPEGGMLVLTDVPALALEFVSSRVFGWPHGVVDAYDLTFHAFGLTAWLLIGAVAGVIAARPRATMPAN